MLTSFSALMMVLAYLANASLTLLHAEPIQRVMCLIPAPRPQMAIACAFKEPMVSFHVYISSPFHPNSRWTQSTPSISQQENEGANFIIGAGHGSVCIDIAFDCPNSPCSSDADCQAGHLCVTTCCGTYCAPYSTCPSNFSPSRIFRRAPGVAATRENRSYLLPGSPPSA